MRGEATLREPRSAPIEVVYAGRSPAARLGRRSSGSSASGGEEEVDEASRLQALLLSAHLKGRSRLPPVYDSGLSSKAAEEAQAAQRLYAFLSLRRAGNLTEAQKDVLDYFDARPQLLELHKNKYVFIGSDATFVFLPSVLAVEARVTKAGAEARFCFAIDYVGHDGLTFWPKVCSMISVDRLILPFY